MKLNKAPILPCEGKCFGWTQHYYAGQRPLTNAKFAPWEQVYQCDKCKNKRRYGLTAQPAVVPLSLVA